MHQMGVMTDRYFIIMTFTSIQIKCSLAELKFSDGEKLTAERQVKKGCVVECVFY